MSAGARMFVRRERLGARKACRLRWIAMDDAYLGHTARLQRRHRSPSARGSVVLGGLGMRVGCPAMRPAGANVQRGGSVSTLEPHRRRLALGSVPSVDMGLL